MSTEAEVIDLTTESSGPGCKIWMVRKTNTESSLTFTVCKFCAEGRFYCTSCFFVNGGEPECRHVKVVRDKFPLTMTPPLEEDEVKMKHIFQRVLISDWSHQMPRDNFQIDMLEAILYGSADALSKIRVRSEATYLAYMQVPAEDRTETFRILLNRKMLREMLATRMRYRPELDDIVDSMVKANIKMNEAVRELNEAVRKGDDTVADAEEDEVAAVPIPVVLADSETQN